MAKPMRVWQIGHPEMGKTWVLAESWEQATVEAARGWGVPWGKVVAQMHCECSYRAAKHVCARCGRIFNGDGALCSACEQTLETEREQDKLRLRKTWYLGAKRTPYGT